MDLFDPKPQLTRMAGKPHPDGVEIHQPNNVNSLLPSPLKFRKHGECGMDVSEALPHVSTIVDDLCFVRSMHTEHNNHEQALWHMHTGRIVSGRPTLGSWVNYALGSENENLPTYVVLRNDSQLPVDDTLIAVYGLFMAPIGWGWALFVWGYALVWFLVNDRVKMVAYRIFNARHPGLLVKKAAIQKAYE